ncbi:MAG: hypothetical protein NT023_02590, partial [Armatimonadetes bacterium]|nr:hypothetical protein [Armatimonadota bacterium]
RFGEMSERILPLPFCKSLPCGEVVSIRLHNTLDSALSPNTLSIYDETEVEIASLFFFVF